MSTAGDGSRLTNSNNSVNSSTAGISGAGETRQIPTPEDRIAEFWENYAERAMFPVVRQDGQKLRSDYAKEQTEEWTAKPATEREEELGLNPTDKQTTAIDGVSWLEAMEETLERYEETRHTTVNLERGQEGEPGYAEFSVESETRWMQSYQQRYYAQLNGWIREVTGGDRPSGGTAEASFEDPYVVLLTRSASATPDGTYMGPVDHAVALRDAWEPTYHTLRNTMRAMGYELGEDWQYERRMEPHKGERGGGTNWCYTHEHTVILVDGEVEPEDFAPVVEKHVDECDPAGADAHDLEDAVEVFPAEDMGNLASYIGTYTGIEPEGLLERDIEYVAWASAMDAGNIRTKSRSDAAKHAAAADKCKQQCEDERTDQDETHGERVIRSHKRGCTFECAECGSPHEIDQDAETLTARRLSDDQAAVADGGRDFEEERQQDLEERWQDARAAASVGESPDRRKERERLERAVDKWPEADPYELAHKIQPPPKDTDLLEEVCVGFGPSGGGDRGGKRVRSGSTIEGREVRLGGGEGWCPACHTENPESDQCPHPDYVEHPLQEGAFDADATVRTGSDRFRGNGEIPFEYESEPVHDGPVVGFEREPKWRVKSVTVRDEEYPASAGNGIDMVEVDASDGESGLLDTFRGRETPAGKIQNVMKWWQGGDEPVECAATGAAIDGQHLGVYVDGKDEPVPVAGPAALGSWTNAKP